jgi:hypothetical protein
MQNLLLSLQRVDNSHHKNWPNEFVSCMYQLIIMKNIIWNKKKYQSTHLIPIKNIVGRAVVLVEVQSCFIVLLGPKSRNLSKFNK